MKKLTTLSLFLLFGLAFTPPVQAQPLPLDERQNIETMIKQVASPAWAGWLRFAALCFLATTFFDRLVDTLDAGDSRRLFADVKTDKYRAEIRGS